MPTPRTSSVWLRVPSKPGDPPREPLLKSSSPLDFDDRTLSTWLEAGLLKRFARDGIRLVFGNTGGSGVLDRVYCANGTEINVANCVLPTLSRRSFQTAERTIMLRALLSCDVTFTVDGQEPLSFKRPELTLISMPKGLRFTTDLVGGVLQQGFVGMVPAALFLEAFGLQEEDLPPALHNAVFGSGDLGRIVSFKLDHRVAGLVADTLDSELEGEARALQYQGRLTELVAYVIDAMHKASPDQRHSQLLWREADVAQSARDRLAKEYRRPPPVAQLAKDLGTNANKLRASFKSAFGTTMAEYCLARRMREAQQLLLEAKLSIAEVAQRVGYEHQSGFTYAFTSHLGMTPGEYRRQRAPFSLPLGNES